MGATLSSRAISSMRLRVSMLTAHCTQSARHSRVTHAREDWEDRRKIRFFVHRLQRGALPPLCKAAENKAGACAEKATVAEKEIRLESINVLRVEKMPHRGPVIPSYRSHGGPREAHIPVIARVTLSFRRKKASCRASGGRLNAASIAPCASKRRDASTESVAARNSMSPEISNSCCRRRASSRRDPCRAEEGSRSCDSTDSAWWLRGHRQPRLSLENRRVRWIPRAWAYDSRRVP